MCLLNLCFALLGIHAVFAPSPFNSDFDELWSEFMIKFERQYEPSEEGARRLIWEQNAGKIMKHNFETDMGMHSYRLSINKFADMTPKEMQKMRGCAISANTAKKGVRTFVHKLDFILPSAVDWRDQGYVTQIKDQGACGSCWAFSAVGSLEGQHMATAGKLVSLSEQNLVDCSQKQGNQGCNGGWMDNAFEYVHKNKGIDTEKSYPYLGKDMRCKFNSSTVGATCKGYADLPQFNETALQAAAALIGPISVAIDASSDDFMFYESGIYNDKTCSQMELDHGVLVVGYGTTNGTDYWIVKNSWGMSWGEDGYILMSRNKKNQCGIATAASYPLM